MSSNSDNITESDVEMAAKTDPSTDHVAWQSGAQTIEDYFGPDETIYVAPTSSNGENVVNDDMEIGGNDMATRNETGPDMAMETGSSTANNNDTPELPSEPAQLEQSGPELGQTSTTPQLVTPYVRGQTSRSTPGAEELRREMEKEDQERRRLKPGFDDPAGEEGGQKPVRKRKREIPKREAKKKQK